MRRLAGAIAAWLVLTAASPAGAADPRAEQLFAEGRAAMDAQQWDAACKKFEESLSLERALGPLLNLAECRDKQGMPARSLELWSQALASMPADEGRRELAERKIADLERRVPKLLVQASEGARVFIDGIETKADEPTRVEPGTRSVVVKWPGGSRELSAVAREGAVTTVDARQPTAAPPSPGAVDDDAVDLTTPAIIALAVGGAGLIGFGVTGGLYLSESATVDEHCTPEACRDQEGVDAAQARATLGGINAVALGVGVIGVGLGAVLLLSTGGDEGEPSARLTVRPELAGGTSLSLDGRF